MIPIVLCKFDDAPSFVKDNPYIINGYRPLLTMKQCFKSAFVWTNETLNIWTHFIGFLVCLGIMIYHLIVMTKVTWLDNLIFSLGLVCSQVCQLFSISYHMFKTHSFKFYEIFLNLDYFGIFFAFFGCLLPLFHAGFHCFDTWYVFYMGIAFSFFFSMVLWFFYVAGLCCLCLRKSKSKDIVVVIGNKMPGVRTAGINNNAQTKEQEIDCAFCPMFTYSGLTAATLMPSIHWIYLNGGFSGAAPKLFVPKLFILYIVILMAFMIYIAKFPECLRPGAFDFIGASHQIWHILVTTSFIWCYYVSVELLIFVVENDCFTRNNTLT